MRNRYLDVDNVIPDSTAHAHGENQVQENQLDEQETKVELSDVHIVSTDEGDTSTGADVAAATGDFSIANMTQSDLQKLVDKLA